MRNKRLILGFALVALIVGYIELRLPPPVAAQGTDAVFQRLAVSSDARVSGTATVGVLKFETALTPTITARLAASGTASASTYLRGDGSWDDPLEAFRGQIAAFNGACPTDWNEVTALRGRFIVGLVDGGTLAGTRGTALTDLETRRGGTVHPNPVHRITGHGTGDRKVIVASGFSDSIRLDIVGSGTGGITVDNDTTVASGSLNQKLPAPYVQLRYCEYQP